MVKDDFKYLGFDVYYLPHPCLYGKWEIFKNEEFIARANTKKEVKILCKENIVNKIKQIEMRVSKICDNNPNN